MKKILLSLFAIVMAISASAQTINFTEQSITANDNGFTLEVAPYTFTALKNTGSTVPTQNANYKDLRIYAKGTLEVATSGSAMTEMVFTVSAQGKKRLTDITASTGEVKVDAEAWTVTWTGSATDVTFTVGDKATYGTDGNTKAGQFDVDAVTITAGDAPVTTKKGAGLKWSETSVSVLTGSEFTSPTFEKATTAAVTFASDNESVAKANSDGIITLGGEEGTATITATSAENDEYYAGTATLTVTVYHYNYYVKTTEIVSGKKYLLVAQRNDSTFYAYPLADTKTYGYLSVGTIPSAKDTISIKSSYDDTFTITDDGGDYAIADPYGRYLSQSGTYNSFQLTNDEVVWTTTKQSDGTFKFEMNGYTIQWGKGTYKTFAIYTDVTDGAVLPYLYVETEIDPTAISTVSAETPASTAVYNMAGQRVSDSYKGIVIKNGKKYLNK